MYIFVQYIISLNKNKNKKKTLLIEKSKLTENELSSGVLNMELDGFKNIFFV